MTGFGPVVRGFRLLDIYSVRVVGFLGDEFTDKTRTGLPGVIPGLYTETGSVAIVDVFFWTPQSTFSYTSDVPAHEYASHRRKRLHHLELAAHDRSSAQMVHPKLIRHRLA